MLYVSEQRILRCSKQTPTYAIQLLHMLNQNLLDSDIRSLSPWIDVQGRPRTKSSKISSSTPSDGTISLLKRCFNLQNLESLAPWRYNSFERFSHILLVLQKTSASPGSTRRLSYACGSHMLVSTRYQTHIQCMCSIQIQYLECGMFRIASRRSTKEQVVLHTKLERDLATTRFHNKFKPGRCNTGHIWAKLFHSILKALNFEHTSIAEIDPNSKSASPPFNLRLATCTLTSKARLANQTSCHEPSAPIFYALLWFCSQSIETVETVISTP